MKSAIILCSGGIDSVTTAYYVKKKLKYRRITILFFDYGQKSLKIERKCAKNCASNLGAKFIEIKLKWLGKISSSLMNKSGKINKIKNLKNTKKESERFYVPCRNTLFLAYTLALADSIFIKNGRKNDIFIGFKCEGKESYPDTTPEYLREINRLAAIGCSSNFKILAPLIKRDKEDIILLGKKFGIDFKDTFSCYSPIKGKHCGFCLACQLRKAGFYWAGEMDNAEYQN